LHHLEPSLDSSSKRSLDSSSPSARPSHKRCRPPTTLVPSSTPVSGSIAPAFADICLIRGIGDHVGAPTKGGIGMEVEVATSDISGIYESTGGDAPNLEERAGLADRVRSLGWENLRVQALLCIERDLVDNLRRHMALSQEEFCQIRRDRNVT
nr:hypothetical protein [Tanacetum cinerariifolium]